MGGFGDPGMYGDILWLRQCAAQAVLQVASRCWFQIKKKIIE